MKGRTIALIVGGLVVAGVVLYFATKTDAPAGTVPGDGTGANVGGIVSTVGTGLTGIVAAIAGAVSADSEEARLAAQADS